MQQAMMGQVGTLMDNYLSTILPILTKGEELGSPSVHHRHWPVPCTYVVETLLSQLVTLFKQHLPALTYSTFRGEGNEERKSEERDEESKGEGGGGGGGDKEEEGKGCRFVRISLESKSVMDSNNHVISSSVFTSWT